MHNNDRGFRNPSSVAKKVWSGSNATVQSQPTPRDSLGASVIVSDSVSEGERVPDLETRERMTGEDRTVVVSANSCWNIVNFRLGLIRALRSSGYRIVVVAPEDGHRAKLDNLGVRFVPMPMNSSGVSVIEDLRLFARYLKSFRELRPSAYLGFTAKPNIYGSLAARMVGAKVINNVSGLGTVFIKRGPLTCLL